MVSAQPGLVIGIVESHEPLSRALAALILIELGTQIVGGRNEQEFIDKLDGRQPQVVLIGDDPAKADGTGKIISWVSNLFPHCHAVSSANPMLLQTRTSAAPRLLSPGRWMQCN